ncbi:glycoside hydrolase family 32 protein [Pseudalkalibacillus sp. R45]|uniref:glycoside hydrolase family 32 protein n=1 Tax=Pseudalkalibacillus sp. R45 TaxID=3457433 RepID=UPI003FCC2C83
MQNKDRSLRKKAYEEIKKYQEVVDSDPYRLDYHLMPPVGLMNDPNGLIHWKGEFHVFFQWMPFKTGHGAKFWGHYSSRDLIHWTWQPIALTPSEWYEQNGCYSGSAVNHEGKLNVFYTGNVKNDKGERETYQCLAVSEDGIHFEKKGVVIHLPEGYSAHFRDPKVWKHQDKWYMIIGAQTKEQLGCAVLYTSDDLMGWELKGEISSSKEHDYLGYMWECPDLFHLDDIDVFMFSPQGLGSQGIHYNNVHQSGYVIGELDYDRAVLHHGPFCELDRGFEFYAPQTTLDDEGRRILIGWMGVPDQDEEKQPTRAYKWIHNMTIPRELRVKKGKIRQSPVKELKKMRRNLFQKKDLKVNDESLHLSELDGAVMEVFLKFGDADAFNRFEIDLFDYAKVIYQNETKVLTLERKNVDNKSIESRSCQISKLETLQLFIDHSSIEVFVNEGEEVFTARIFPDKKNASIHFSASGSVTFDLWKWDLTGYTYQTSEKAMREANKNP